jgi:hypothetical protein
MCTHGVAGQRDGVGGDHQRAGVDVDRAGILADARPEPDLRGQGGLLVEQLRQKVRRQLAVL